MLLKENVTFFSLFYISLSVIVCQTINKQLIKAHLYTSHVHPIPQLCFNYAFLWDQIGFNIKTPTYPGFE